MLLRQYIGILPLLLVLAVLACRQAFANTPAVVRLIESQSIFFETFDGDDWQSRWKHSADAKYNGRFTVDAGTTWTDKGLKIPEKNKYYGLTALLAAPVDPVVSAGPDPLPLVVQYEVAYSGGVGCGGSYLKLLSADEALTAEGLVDSTPYSIMFGPDRCGGPGKVHLIFRHHNPVNGTVTEKHLAAPPVPESDDRTHVYTLRLFPDHKYEVLIDGAVKSSGNLLDAATLEPSLLPPREIPDPEDSKPADWVDVEEIPDPDATKPGDWDDREQVADESAVKPRGWREDESELINDPAAKRPADWDEEEDGVWEPNQIRNPKCKVGCGPWKRPMKPNPAWKGAWKPPLIPNPAYKGPWVQKRIPNPHYFEEAEPLRTGVRAIGAVALELWTTDSGYMFDNVLITRDPAVAEMAVQRLWKPRYDAEVKAFDEKMKANQKEEEEKKKQEAKSKKKKSRKGGRHGTEQLEELVESFLNLFEDGAILAPLAPVIAPLEPYLRSNPANAILMVGLAPLMALALAMVFRSFSDKKGGKASAGSDGPAAEGAEGAAADQAAAEEDGAEAEDGGATTGTVGEGGPGDDPGEPSEASEAKAAPPVQEEITADDEDADEDADEEGEAVAGVRRRTRRAA